LGIIAIFIAYQRDILAKTSVIFYEFDQEMEKAYELFLQKANQIVSCDRKWHIAAKGQVYDRKYHAGANSLVKRNNTFIEKKEPPNVKTNVETIAIGVGRQTLYFFPDRIFVYDYNGVGAVNYNNLNINVRQSQFIESDGVSRDAKIVDYTWKYVNKKGGPDRRFKDNSQLPICLYDEITLTSTYGINEVIQLSRYGVGEEFNKAIQFLANKLPKEVMSSEY